MEFTEHRDVRSLQKSKPNRVNPPWAPWVAYWTSLGQSKPPPLERFTRGLLFTLANRKSNPFWKLERLWRCLNISISTKIKLFNTTCVTVLLYGCESWVLSKAMESEINAFGTSCYRIMLNIKRIDRVSNAKIYDLTQTAPLVENVRTRQLRFLGHVLRMPDDEPCKEYALYIPPHGKRKPGRQRTLFLRYIQHLLGDTDNMIGPGKLSELAQDRCGWRKLVVACSAADR